MKSGKNVLLKKRLLSMLLVFTMLFSSISVSAAPEEAAGSLTDVSISESLDAQAGEQTLEPAVLSKELVDVNPQESSFAAEAKEEQRISQIVAEELPQDDEIVDLIVVLDKEPLLSVFSAEDIKADTKEVAAYREKQQQLIKTLENDLKEEFGEEDGFSLGFCYTASVTGISVKTKYGNKETIEQMKSVEKVYISPTFQISAQDVIGYTNNASVMIGATNLNDTGYTGEGMKIAILDTGIVVDHPSFGALPEDKLTETSLTKEYVKEVWETLNASKTELRNTSYYNSKLPFVFNYNGMNFDVSHNTAQHDHGTHVAGIAAANKIESSEVVGIAPDAQVIVMQVFNTSGGAEWSTILAALEDCLKLDVDTVNLSLGMAAGFTDGDLEMTATLAQFEKTDIQVVIAGGNDTNNAYMNRTGLDLSKTKDPDNGLVGTPATVSSALAVASAENDGADLLYFTVGDKRIGFSDSAVSDATNFFLNHKNQTLEFVSVGGVGNAGDYAGINVKGKVAVVSRGIISFQEKQEAAKNAGAIALVVYNNVPGSFSMAISDGTGHIPCISISRTDGEYLRDLNSGELKVCSGDLIHVNLDRAMSDFSSWGVTPDLKLRPEITGVGGNIYSTRDRELSGSNYGNMSGTSMASPQVAGAITVLTQYLRENYKHAYASEQELRQLAVNVLMSTAAQIMEVENEYSPRKQGAGLVNLNDAIAAGAYLSNPDTKEERPKAEMGDNDSKNGKYTFAFEITNMSSEEKHYSFDSSVLTADVKDGYMANSDRALQAKVQVSQNGTDKMQVTVPANGTVSLSASIQLSAEDMAFINDHFENGNYVEGYLYVNSEDDGGVDLSMPFLGFYGDWSAAPVFDEEGESASLYQHALYTNKSKLGQNPYIPGGKGGDQYNAISYANPLAELVFGLMRNAKTMTSTVKDKTSGKQYFTFSEEYIRKTYYDASYGMIIPYSLFNYNEEILIWNGTDNGRSLPDNTTATYTLEAYLDDGDNIADDSYSFDVTIDNSKPVLVNADRLEESIIKDKANNTVKLPLTIQENHYVAAVIFENTEGIVLGKYEIDNQPGVEITKEFDITGYGTDFIITIADYACNETEIAVSIDLSDMPESYLNPKKLDTTRIYGNETYSDGIVSMGWFSGDKDTFTDLRNETYDANGIVYSGEYINGYVIAQRVSDGAIVFLTPYNTYWNTRTIWKQESDYADAGYKVFYDMALDYSSDRLFAVGWSYAGDTDGNGQDDGNNTLFEIVFGSDGQIAVVEVAPISGLEGGAEALTLGCTTEGQLYTICGNGNLYTLTKSGEAVYVGTTDFVELPNYSGVNVIQPMGYDHNTGKMYWFAHSQTLRANAYRNIGVIYEVDLEDASCRKLADSDSSGYTALFVPTERTSDIFTPNVTATGIEITPAEMSLVKGQTKRMNVEWKPWNALPGSIEWESKDSNVASVNKNGVVRAVGEGSTEIIATAKITEDGSVKTVTHSAKVTVLSSAQDIYGFVIVDYNNSGNDMSWVVYSGDEPKTVTRVQGGMMWQGGTYYNGYVYTIFVEEWEEDGVLHKGTGIYRSKVAEGVNAADLQLTEQTLIAKVSGVEVGNISFDYSTGRMYGVDYTNGGLCIIDIETGAIDLLGTFTGDLGAAIMPAMCVTINGTIIGSDMFGNLYTVDPDTLHCTKIGSIESDTWYYAGMTYDHNTGNIYWNPCMAENASNLYLVRIDEENVNESTTQIIDLGGVSSSAGVEQTAMFIIPEVEPETHYVMVEGIEITNGEEITGLVGGTVSLKTKTTPARPSATTKEWKSDNEKVAKVDHFGNVSFVGEGTANVTVTVRNKGENVPGPFSDTVKINVYSSAGEFVAFMANDQGGSSYYDYWIKFNDYDPQHANLSTGMIGTYSLRTGEYYDGYLYAYTDAGKLYRINQDNYNDYVTLGSHGLGEDDQVISMTFDYTTGTMYALTLHIGGKPGYLATVDLTNGKITKLHQLDKCISTFATDENGTLYGVGSAEPYAGAAVYIIDKTDGSCEYLQEIPNCSVFIGDNYYGEIMYSPQMTYDYGAQRFYLNATLHYKGYNSRNYGFYMIQMEGEGAEKEISLIANLGKPSVELRDSVKTGEMLMGLLCAIPEAGEVKAEVVSGIVLNKDAARLKKGESMQLMAQISPSGIQHKGVEWSSQDSGVATVDKNGLVTGVSAGTTTITAVSLDNAKISAACQITVIADEAERTKSIAYTISADQEALLSFDPEIPASTVQKISTMSGGKRIIGMDIMNENYLYYALEGSIFPELYRYDMTTKQSVGLGDLYVFIGGASDMAYDPVHNLIYIVSGFYVFQFEVDKLKPGEFNNYSGYLDTSQAAMPLSNMHAVTCIDGNVYFLGSSNGATLYRVDDELKNLTKIRDVAVNTVSGECEMDYDENTKKFYLTDAGDRLYSFEENGDTVTLIDMVGDGIDINGLAIGTVVSQEEEEPERPKVTDVFTDVEGGAWYVDSVQYVYDEGIIVGDGNIFAPDSATTRAMVAVILYRLAGSPVVSEADYVEYNKFIDLPKGHLWYSDAVAWALKEGVSTGDDVNMMYNPNLSVTREQLALFLWRYSKYKGDDVKVTATEKELFGSTYVNEWAKEGFAWAIDKGIIKGAEITDSAGNVCYDLNPQGSATRAQLARMLHRFCEK